MKIYHSIILGLVSSISFVFACKCVPHSVEECFNHSSVVFHGKVSGIYEYVDKDTVYHRRVTFTVLEKWKGELKDSVWYEEIGSNCNYIFNDKTEYLIFGDSKDLILETSKCSSTQPWKDAKRDIEIIQKLSAIIKK